jgi:dihydroneopterin aldolase
MANDFIAITGIRAYGYTGFLPEEQHLGQWFEVHLKLWLDLSQAGSSDCLEDTYDYSQNITAVQNLIKTEKFLLIETLAEAIAASVLASKKVDQVEVHLTKLTPPIPDFNGQVAINIIRKAL